MSTLDLSVQLQQDIIMRLGVREIQGVCMKAVTRKIVKKRPLIDVQSSTDKKLAKCKTARHCRTPIKSNIVSMGSRAGPSRCGAECKT